MSVPALAVPDGELGELGAFLLLPQADDPGLVLAGPQPRRVELEHALLVLEAGLRKLKEGAKGATTREREKVCERE